VKPIPVVFHIGALQIHTYGIGLAITFWFAYRYFAKRLRDHGYPDAWLGKAFAWIIVGAIVGARAVHVISMWSFYSHNLGDIFAVWHGGLSSFGGLIGGVPIGLWCAHRWCPKLRLMVAADLVSIVLLLAWAVGRLLGPQVMYQGGGYRTTAWYGMAYAGQAGKRLPVPVFQAIECFIAWAIALQIEKFVRRRGGPIGVVLTASITLYGVSRFFDETVLLPHNTSGDQAVIGAAAAFVIVGACLTIFLVLRFKPVPIMDGAGLGDPWAAPPELGSSPPADAGADADAGNTDDELVAGSERDPADSQAAPQPSS
jgi:phosphatidylglycerol:prolipoprotein diacylglycerol transferase